MGPAAEAHLGRRPRLPELRHALRDVGGWVVETVEEVGEVRGSLSLALDPAGALHGSYRPRQPPCAPPVVGYARRTPAGAWLVDPLEPPPAPVDLDVVGPTVAADGAGGVHLAYGRFAEPLVYAYRRFCP